MNTYKIIVSYDGTDYFGWQIQPAKKTIAGVLQAHFKERFGHDITLVGASRTDGGVHALGQVARFYSPLTIEDERFRKAFNAHLPKDIHLRKLQRVRDDFHPQREVEKKIYQYHIVTERPLPGLSRFVTLQRPFDLAKFQEAVQLFVGTHDFRSFCTGNDLENTVRTVEQVTITYKKRYGIYQVTVVGPGFLRYMIRRMVGAALYVAINPTEDISSIASILSQKNPLHHLPTAPAHGLLLRKIIYKGSYDNSIICKT